MDVDFFIVDQRFMGSSMELYEDTLENIKNALKQFACTKACFPGKEPYIVCVIGISSEANVILKPQRFNLISFHQAVDQLGSPCVSFDANVSSSFESAFEHSLALTEIIKKKQSQVSRIRISCLSSLCLTSSSKSTSIFTRLFDEDINANFYKIVFPIGFPEDNISEHFADFVILVREWVNCSLSRIESNKYALHRLMTTLVQPSASDNLRLQLNFPNNEKLMCEINTPLFDYSGIPSVELCLCHGKKISLSDDSHPTCTISGDPLQPEKRPYAVVINNLIIRGATPEPSPIIECQAIKCLHMDSVSDTILQGQPHQLFGVPPEDPKFAALCTLLHESNEALLVTTRIDLDSGRFTFLTQNFAIFPERDGIPFLHMKQIATFEQLKHTRFVGPIFQPEDIKEVMRKTLLPMPHVDYNPLDESNELYSQIARAVSAHVPPEQSTLREIQSRPQPLSRSPAKPRSSGASTRNPPQQSQEPRRKTRVHAPSNPKLQLQLLPNPRTTHSPIRSPLSRSPALPSAHSPLLSPRIASPLDFEPPSPEPVSKSKAPNRIIITPKKDSQQSQLPQDSKSNKRKKLMPLRVAIDD